MVRRYTQLARANSRGRWGKSALPAVVALAGLGLVVGAVFLLGGGSDTGVIEDSRPFVSAEKPAATDEPVATIAPESSVAEVREDAPAAAVDQSQQRIDLVKAQLASGEFGPAIATAQSTTDAAEQTQLLKLVVAAQLKTGDFDGALATIRQIPIPAERDLARSQRVDEMTLAGGGSGADFTQLIELIQSETTGPWEEDDGEGGTISEYETGVRVDPNGVLARITQAELDGRLHDLGVKARAADINEDMARASGLRLVSLTRLEREVAKRMAEGRPVVETMKNLAGLSRIQYVFVYPEEREIVIAGPAEGWRYNENGLAVGDESGRPAMQLDDLVTVLRTFADGGRGIFGCSINPRQQGMKALKDYVEASVARGPLRAGAGVRNWAKVLQQKLGLQDIDIYGVPKTSRAARVIVEADYRMKMIGIGKMDGGSSIPSIFDLFTEDEQKSGKLDALRWWLSIKCDTVMHSPERNVFEIQGSSVLCQSENQHLTDQGERVQTGKADATNQHFASNFTKHYEELARRDIVFADLQNVFDSALVAALVQHEQLANRIGWDLGVFGPKGAYRPAEYEAPKVVDSVVNHRVYRGKDVVVQVAGGVQANVMAEVTGENAPQASPRLAGVADQGKAPKLPAGRWWWDAAK